MIEKIVLTGAPGSGKSTTIRILEYDWQERTIAEAAEDMIKTFRKQGYDKPWELPHFQDRILELQLQRESQLDALDGRVFIDRGILDGLAYYQIRGNTPSTAMITAIRSCKETKRYSKVFLMDRPDAVEQNGIRYENAEEAQRLQELQFQNYTDAGYQVERIPYSLGIEGRARKIIESLQKLKGGESKWSKNNTNKQ